MENKDIIITYNTAMEQIRKLKRYAQRSVVEDNKQLEGTLNEQKERLQQAEQEVADKNAQIDELVARTTALANRTEENERKIEEYQELVRGIHDAILECAKDTLNEDNYRAVAGMDNIKNVVFYMMYEMKKMADMNKELYKKVEEQKQESTRTYAKKEGKYVKAEAEDIPCFGTHKHRLLCEELCEYKDKCKVVTEERKESIPDCIGDDVFKAECRVCPFILRCVELQAFRHRMRILLHHDW